ncbi:T9SS type A sorting domain-containing protein [Ferruginibacter paludis]|uniref:T9SS type A sorting domain-containing protein n=1 Tax=Ferruginibacter paludis TaxID=1310417 RepID=UPI0025B2B1D4|nr:T9SS type A sorting domain-containing protein [Ferruginibacter paludis]MDN3655827.1 T9SS type A sorting domain-containing protein [Ferruginibacter paludis]
MRVLNSTPQQFLQQQKPFFTLFDALKKRSIFSANNIIYTRLFLLMTLFVFSGFIAAFGQVSKNYQHWADGDAATGSTATWQGDILNANKSDYFEGEVIPHVYAIPASNNKPFVQNQFYTFTIVYNYYQSTNNAGGFAYITTYNASRAATTLPGTSSTIVQDNTYTGSIAGSFYRTANADITAVSAPVTSTGGNKDQMVTVTFKYTGATTTSGYVVIYYGLYIATPGQVPSFGGTNPTKGASAWSGGSLQTTVTSDFSGALSIQLAPSAIIPGTISGLKYQDLNKNATRDNGEPVLSGWTIFLDNNNNGTLDAGETSTTTATDGTYSFSVTPDANKSTSTNDPYIVREVLKSGWTQTQPATGSYSVTITSLAPIAANKDFGNFTCINPSTPTADLTQPTCALATGTISVTAPTGMASYTVTGTNPVVAAVTHAGTSFAGLSPGVYDVTATNSVGCTSAALSVTINAQPATPATPTITSVAPTCSAAGSSTISNYSASNTYAFTPSGPSVDAGGLISGMTVGTSYTVTSNNGSCTSAASAPFSNAAMLATPAAPTITSVPATCSAAGSSTISNFSASNTYVFTPSGPSVGTGGLISGMTVGTSYTVTSNNGSCTSLASASFSNAANLASPTFKVCVVQPTLCSTGSLTINATGGTGFLYTIDGTDPTASNTSNVFTNLGVGSVTTIKVKNSDGCSAAPVNCADIVSDCSGARLANNTTTAKTADITEKQTTIKAYPNPFSDKVKFVVTSPVSGTGNLEVYNTMGQKIKTVYAGLITAGSHNFELSLPVKNAGSLIYILRIGDKKMTGTLLQMNR